ncbi:RHS repeat-associated core domain-containing protein, partial [Chloroflexota bacterium]
AVATLMVAQQGQKSMTTAVLLGFFIILFVVCTQNAYADDGGWLEAGGTFSDWIQSEGATKAIMMGLPAALGALIGALLGGAVGGLGSAESVIQQLAEQGLIDTTGDGLNLLGGKDDNPYTVHSGGNGSGICGLPNYWVNTATLGLVVQDTIFRSGGLGPPIAFTLTYNSFAGNSGMFGNKWQFSYESFIDEIGGDVLLWKGSGQRLRYRPGSPANQQGPSAPLEALSLDARFDRLLDYGEYWLFIEKATRLMYRYDKSPGTNFSRLAGVSDYNGNTAQILYSGDGTIRSITDAAGRDTRFTYDGNRRCISLTVADGRSASFAYDDQGNLIRALDMLGIPSLYEYNAEQYMTRMIVGIDLRTTIFTYQDSGQGKHVVGVTNAIGNTTHYETVSSNPRRVRVVDPEGKATEYHNAEGLTERIIDPLGNSIIYGYVGGLRVSIQNRNGHLTRMEYDARGNMTKYTDALGNTRTFVFDAYDNLVSATGPLGETWGNAYDARLNLIKITSPIGRLLTLDYDPKGQLVATADSHGAGTTFGYDGFGNISVITDPNGKSSHISYDEHGLNITAITDAHGNTTQYEYDENGRLTMSIRPDGTSRSYTYDCCAGIATTDENGHTMTYLRDPALLVRELTDPMGNVARFDYDRCSRLVKEVDALGRSWMFGYDDAGRKIERVNPAGQSICLKFDPEDNLIAIVDERGKQTTYGYDANNNLTTITDPLGHTKKCIRDRAGRLSAVANARGGTVSQNYNSDGQISAKFYDSVQVGAYEYDTTGNLTKVTDVTGKTTYQYDNADQLRSIRYPDGLEVTFSYNEVRNISAITYPGDLVVQYAYDNRNRVVSIVWSENSVASRYDATGALVGVSRSNGTKTSYAYNADRMVTEIKHQSGDKTFAHMQYIRDAVRNITDESGILPLEASLSDMRVEITFNDANQVTTRGSDHYIYDADGNLTEISGGKWRAVYDHENRPIEVARNGIACRYTYNGLRLRTRVETVKGVRNYYHDPRGRVLFETDNSGSIVSFYIYDQSSLVARVTPSGEVHFYHFDKTGSTLALSDGNGNIVSAYAYAPFGDMAKRTGDVENPFTYVGALGVMDEGDGLFFMKHRYYDAHTGRFIHRDPLGIAGGINLYAYVRNNPVVSVDPHGLQLGPVGGPAIEGGEAPIPLSESMQPYDPGSPFEGGGYTYELTKTDEWIIWGIDEFLTYYPATATPYGLIKGTYLIIQNKNNVEGYQELFKAKTGNIGLTMEIVQDVTNSAPFKAFEPIIYGTGGGKGGTPEVHVVSVPCESPYSPGPVGMQY